MLARPVGAGGLIKWLAKAPDGLMPSAKAEYRPCVNRVADNGVRKVATGTETRFSERQKPGC